jgi:hypothetical protein
MALALFFQNVEVLEKLPRQPPPPRLGSFGRQRVEPVSQ